MNKQVTIEKMKDMRLHGMSEIYHRSMKEHLFSDYTADEFIQLLIDTEWESRQNNKIKNLIQAARFRLSVSTKDIDYTSKRNLDKNMFERLLSLLFIEQKENIIITGATGVGKSYLAHGLGYCACQNKIRTSYFNASQMMDNLKLAKLDGTYSNIMKRIHKSSLLIIDDFGLQPFDTHARQVLMEIIEDRHQQSSTIITSQIPVAEWHEMIGEATIADAILDRLVHSSHRIALEGESMRKNIKLKG